MNKPIPFPRHGIPGYYALADLPQLAPWSESALSTGYGELDHILKIYPTQLVVCTGNPGSGKSTFLFNLIINLCYTHRKKAWLYVPENEMRLFQKLEGIFGDKPGGSLFGQFASTKCFIQSSQYEHYEDEPRTIEWILDKAYQSYEKDGVSLIMIDPWNELERAKANDELLTDYIGRCLMRIKMFARLTNCTMFIVAHPTKASVGRDVQLSDIEGSMNWFNKCDNGLIVKHEPGSQETTVLSAKVREQPHAGRPGHCIFLVDPESGMFKEQVGGGQVL
jgi:twinkle protein